MNILISGGSGFIGQELTASLLMEGHKVYILTRRVLKSENENLTYIRWEDIHTPLDLSSFHFDIVINLMGENIATSRWNNEKKKKIYNSRVDGTKNLIKSLGGKRIKLFISASAIGYYGSNREEVLLEESSPGSDFMSKVVADWEEEIKKALAIADRFVILRLGVVLSKDGGMMKKILPLFRTHLGGKLASGSQFLSFIHLNDVVRVIMLAFHSEMSGIYNLTTPYPVTNSEFTDALGKILHKTTFFKAPRFVLKFILGELSETVLSNQKVFPERLLTLKYHFLYPTIELALKEVVSKKT